MSILLDALRKSESQRRRGELPNIHSGVPIEGPARRAPAAWPWAIALVALLIAAGAAWRAGWLGPPPEEAALPAPTPMTTVDPPGTQPNDTAPVVALPEAGAADGARTPLERLRDRAPPGTQPVVVDGPVPPPAPAAGSASAQAPATIAPAGDNTPGDGVEVHPLSEAPPPTAPSARDLEAAVSEVVTEAPPPAPVPSQPAAEAAGPAPMEFWELPLNIRQGLPDFRITVLVYDQDPAGRFVLLNGERQVEGDVVAPDLVLEQIRRDGAVFRHGRYRFLVKR